MANVKKRRRRIPLVHVPLTKAPPVLMPAPLAGVPWVRRRERVNQMEVYIAKGATFYAELWRHSHTGWKTRAVRLKNGKKRMRIERVLLGWHWHWSLDVRTGNQRRGVRVFDPRRVPYRSSTAALKAMRAAMVKCRARYQEATKVLTVLIRRSPRPVERLLPVPRRPGIGTTMRRAR